jgi:RNA polymerase-binding protein DksA
MSAIDLEAFRRKLLEERQKVVAALAHLHEENRGSLEEEAEEVPLDNHLAETATVTLDREIDYTLEENAAHVLAAIDAALARIDAGSYGTCSSCGQPIAPERLEALPYATQCIDCKRKEERG